jgi:prepilin-type N-terminal cleavage/methylation domain-containing protein
MRRAFTLLELIVVVAIIAGIAGVGSVFVREYGEQRNATLTDRKAAAVVEGLMRTENDGSVWYAEGFIADIGTFPPELSALHNEAGENMKLIHADESNVTKDGLLSRRVLIRRAHELGGLLLPAPFLEDNGTDADCNGCDYPVALYGGYAGPYGPETLDDGWGHAMEFNGTVAFAYDVEAPLTGLRSAGADRRFADEGVSPVKEEFDEFADAATEKAAYGEDRVKPLPQRRFRPESLAFDIAFADGNASDTNQTDIVIYTPMLYFVEDTNCTFDDVGTTANRFKWINCGGVDREWQRFAPDGNATSADATYALGVAKYRFTIGQGDMNLSVNNVAVPDFDASAFMRASRVTFDTGSAWNIIPAADTNTSFYLFGGAKSVVIFRDGTFEERFTWIFKPGRNEKLRYEQ